MLTSVQSDEKDPNTTSYIYIYPFYHIDTSTLNSETWRASIEELCIIFTLIVYNMENEWQIIGLQDAKKCTNL